MGKDKLTIKEQAQAAAIQAVDDQIADDRRLIETLNAKLEKSKLANNRLLESVNRREQSMSPIEKVMLDSGVKFPSRIQQIEENTLRQISWLETSIADKSLVRDRIKGIDLSPPREVTGSKSSCAL